MVYSIVSCDLISDNCSSQVLGLFLHLGGRDDITATTQCNSLSELQADPQPETYIYTDSQLVEGFLVKDWKPKCNQILVEKMRMLVNQCRSFKVVKVKGHNGDPENEVCHKLARQAVKEAIECA